MRWQEQAACKGHDWLMFDRASTEQAKRLCAGCPVLAECRDWILATEPPDYGRHGVCAGMTPAERDRVVRGRPVHVRRPPRWSHGTLGGYNSGCRCEQCRVAMRYYKQQRRDRVTA